MKKHFTQRSQRFKFVLGCLFWLMMFNNLNAQNVTLTWDKESGCQIYKPREKKAQAETPDIGSGECVRVCEESEVIYTLNNSSGISSIVWTVTGGTISGPNNGTSCTVVWGNAGFGFVSATYMTINGQRTKEMCLEVITGPKPEFTIVPGFKEFCRDETVYFTNTSSANGGSQIISYFWDFGDNTFSSEFEPSHTYHEPGPKKIRLTVTNECNCSKDYYYEIYINETTAFPITCNSVVCENGTDDYSIPEEVAKKCDGFNNWKVIGGTILSQQPYGGTITVQWDNVGPGGFGYVIYDGSECGIKCAQTAIKVPVITYKTEILGESIVCANNQYRYKLPQWPTTDFVWSVVANGTGATIINTDQRNEVIVNTVNEGDITLRCTYRNSMLKCGGYTEFNIHVKAMGIISGPKEICQNTSHTYSVNNGYTGTWTLKKPNNSVVNFTGNNFQHLFDVPGNYTLSIVGDDFCPPSAPFIIRVDAIPATPLSVQIQGPSVICTGTPIQYSMINTVPGTVLVWAATNGVISGSNYGNTITVVFTPGFLTYNVRVWRENIAAPHCESRVASKRLREEFAFVDIDTATNPVCASSTNQYHTNYTQGEVYEWSVSPAIAGSVASGNGSTNVTILWNQLSVPNTEVILKVRRCNIWYTVSYPVTVVLSPTISITGMPSIICPGDSVTPAISPALTSGMATWNFGDGTPLVTVPANQTPSHQYGNVASSTTYTITVMVANPNGCLTPATANKTVTVNPAPVALITPDPDQTFCDIVDPFILTVTIQSGVTGTANITWYKNGSIVSSGTNPNLFVDDFGDYRALVSNPNGCGQFTNTVRVINKCNNGCVIIPEPTNILGLTQNGCNVIDATAAPNPTPVSYAWSAGPEATVSTSTTVNSASFKYKKAGNHTIIYDAFYLNANNQLCKLTTVENKIIPYIAKIKYSVVCGPSGMYTLTLIDDSNFYPSTAPTSKVFTLGTNQYPVSPTTPSYSINVLPGNHTIGITLSRPGFPSCADNMILNLPAMPNSSILSPSAICDGTGFQLTSGSGSAAGLSFNWNFGDGSTNLQAEPVKVYGSPGPKTITLTVSNIYGCSTTSSINVYVNPNQLDGNVTSTSPNCEGDPVILTYNSTGTAPSNYTWMNDQGIVGYSTSPTYPVYNSGSYWVTVGNTLGCTKVTSATPVKFIMSPDPQVTGPDAVCVYESFKLSGYAGGGSLQYRWLLGTTQIAPWSSSAELNYSVNTPGSYTFTVEVRVSDGSGGYCVSSANHALTAYSTPQAPYLYYVVTQCNPYTVKLTADTGVTTGTYTWSNGLQGSDIEVHNGGPFMVTYTSPGGCTSTAQFDVPKDPEEYFWIFPKGCYEFCLDRKEDLVEILGPAPQAQFDEWNWIKDFTWYQSGVGSVPNYNIYSSGTYQMGLRNDICYKETQNMEVNVVRCECKIDYHIKDVRVENKPFCHYLIHMAIDNPYGFPIQVNIAAANNGMGIFTPSVVTVPPGGGGFDVTFIPTGYIGGTSLTIELTSTLGEGKTCRTLDKINLPACDIISSMVNPEGNGNTTNVMSRLNSLVVAPNPSTDVTGLTYAFANEKAVSRSIEIYSLLGVLLETHTPEAQQGKWTVNLGRYAAGQYIVVMREDGVSIAQKAIIKQ